uniref:Very long-chain fatty acid transport protein n=1 Tax=Culicoides sonorensis TaxID=179676 RepID=A0A336MUP2_CULSO
MFLKLNKQQKFITIIGISFIGILSSFLVGYVLALVLTLSLLYGNRPTKIFCFASSIKRDLVGLWRLNRIEYKVNSWIKSNKTVGQLLEETAQQYPDKIALMMNDKKITFDQANLFSNRIATYFKSQGYQKGDTFALFMDTKIEYSLFWFGLSKIGVISSLINHNLRSKTLIHSINVANCTAVIVSTELYDELNDVRIELDMERLSIYVYDELNDTIESLNEKTNYKRKINEISVEIEDFDRTNLNSHDVLLYVYTSGTTGLPKPVIVTHARFMKLAMDGYYMYPLYKNDRIYNPLPLYHIAGGIIGIGLVFLNGISMVLRKKFSVSNYWKDCIQYDCTVAKYVGEICRFLLSNPENPEDTAHNVRLMYGIGLRKQIWHQFQTRFQIKDIRELYGSTEGNIHLVNITNEPGSVGFLPWCFKFKNKFVLVKCDEEGKIMRNSSARCLKCNPGEPGIAIGQISQSSIKNSFLGYVDQEANKRKILTDVFEDGDAYYNSEDILVKDLINNFYFKDRTGDTFRWRGENVSTMEVEIIISNIVDLKDCIVYGVNVPHTEGKAGMAAIVDHHNKIDMKYLSDCVGKELPYYARPVFLRILPRIPITSTCKSIKKDFKTEGFDIQRIKDKLYFLNEDGMYREMTKSDFNDIMNGRTKL